MESCESKYIGEIYLGNTKYLVYIVWIFFFWWMFTNLSYPSPMPFLKACCLMTGGLLVLFINFIWVQMKDPIL